MHIHMPADGEHPLPQNFLFPCALEDLRYTCCGVHREGNFLAQLALADFIEELMVHKGDGKEEKKKKSQTEERKPSLVHGVFSIE